MWIREGKGRNKRRKDWVSVGLSTRKRQLIFGAEGCRRTIVKAPTSNAALSLTYVEHLKWNGNVGLKGQTLSLTSVLTDIPACPQIHETCGLAQDAL